MKMDSYADIFPPMSDRISLQIDEVVEHEIRKKNRFSKRNDLPLIKAAVIIVAILLIAPTGAYAAYKIYDTYIAKTEENEVIVSIYANLDQIAKDKTEVMSLSLNYIPKDLHLNETSMQKYESEGKERGISYAFYRLPESGIKDITEQAGNILQWTTKSGNTAMYFEREQDHGWAQLWVAFTDTYYATQIFVTGLTKSEIHQLAEYAALAPAEEESAVVWEKRETIEFTLRDYIVPENTIVKANDFPIYIETKEVNIEILDYSFSETYPEGLKRQVENLDSDEYSFLTMNVIVHNNLNTAWVYPENSAYICFASSCEEAYKSSLHYMNELVYSNKTNRTGSQIFIYDFEPNETYEATYVFRLSKSNYNDDSLACIFIVATDGCNVLDENDRILLLDKRR